MQKQLKQIIKNMDTSLLGIGIKEEALIKEIDKNKKIFTCDLINSYTKEDKKQKKGKKVKKTSFKKMKKQYKKNKVKYVLCNIEEISDLARVFIRFNIYVNKGVTYIYASKDYDFDKLVRRYKRYTTDYKLVQYNDYYILEINTLNTKNKKIKEFFYSIIDFLEDMIDLLGDVLVN